ncbi:MAG: DUF2335 domain-containing protein [bacterium]|nr:DUF2335 domain-containing protein [bacterium]
MDKREDMPVEDKSNRKNKQGLSKSEKEHPANKQEPDELPTEIEDALLFDKTETGQLLAEIEQDLPEEKRRAIQVLLFNVIRETQLAYKGPLPISSEYNEYEKTLPGAADRIMAMAEKEQESAHKLTDKELEFNYEIEKSKLSNEKFSAILGFTIGTLALLGAILLGVFGQTAVASIIGGLDIVGLVSVFVIGNKALKEKEKKK